MDTHEMSAKLAELTLKMLSATTPEDIAAIMSEMAAVKGIAINAAQISGANAQNKAIEKKREEAILARDIALESGQKTLAGVIEVIHDFPREKRQELPDNELMDILQYFYSTGFSGGLRRILRTIHVVKSDIDIKAMSKKVRGLCDFDKDGSIVTIYRDVRTLGNDKKPITPPNAEKITA